MSKKVIKKNKKNFCTGCGTDAGLLLVSLPWDMWRTSHKNGHRLCPQCIKPLQKLFHKNTDGEIVPVNMWGKGGQSKLFAKLRNAISQKR